MRRFFTSNICLASLSAVFASAATTTFASTVPIFKSDEATGDSLYLAPLYFPCVDEDLTCERRQDAYMVSLRDANHKTQHLNFLSRHFSPELIESWKFRWIGDDVYTIKPISRKDIGVIQHDKAVFEIEESYVFDLKADVDLCANPRLSEMERSTCYQEREAMNLGLVHEHPVAYLIYPPDKCKDPGCGYKVRLHPWATASFHLSYLYIHFAPSIVDAWNIQWYDTSASAYFPDDALIYFVEDMSAIEMEVIQQDPSIEVIEQNYWFTRKGMDLCVYSGLTWEERNKCYVEQKNEKMELALQKDEL